MIHWHEEIAYDFTAPIASQIFTESALFFDIETTGFSPARTHVYMIGCASRKDDLLLIDQFFAPTPGDEKDVLSAFLTHLEQYDTLITFNGVGFDIPYLKGRYGHFHFADPFSRFALVDIFKEVSRIKFLLKLPNFKQKSVESFLGIEREDKFHGGELIDVYHSYVRSPSNEELYLLRQHNYEDVLNMPLLLPILSYARLLDGNFSLVSIEANEYTAMDGSTDNKELLFTLKNTFPVPKRISCGYNEFYLTTEEDITRLRVRLFEGELKYFFDCYKDYYYLPDEDMAVPKSIAAHVDREHRKNATASTCYTKKTAIFLPQYGKCFEPSFQENYKDKKSFFELTAEFTTSEALQQRYINHILQLIKMQKS